MLLWANGVGQMVLEDMRRRFESNESLPSAIHNKIMDYFRKYLLVGGLPDSVNIFLAENNIMNIRKSQTEIVDLYKIDAAKYENDSSGIALEYCSETTSNRLWMIQRAST